MEETRVDRFLFSVRLYKTRTQATEACRGGHVRVNRNPVRPSSVVRVGDVVTAHVGGRERVLEVTRVIDRRVGAAVAAECVVDHSPAREPREPPVFVREPASGRPTKRDRRQLDRLRRQG